MSEININLVRQDLYWLRGNVSGASWTATRTRAALDQLAKENERLIKERDDLKHDMERARDCANGEAELVSTLRTKHAAMQEAIAEAVRRADMWQKQSSARDVAEPLRPHLPTPEPVPVDPLVEVVEDMRSDGYINPTPIETAQRLRAALSARGIEVRKIGEKADV